MTRATEEKLALRLILPHGIVRLNGRTCNQTVHAAYSTDALCLTLRSSSLSCRDHQSLRLAIFSLRPQLPRCRRNVSDARRFTHIRNSQRMVPQVRSDLREQLTTQIPSPGRQVAPR